MSDVLKPQPAPQANTSRPVRELVIEDMQARNAQGTQRYGTPLQAFNGREAVVAAYQEALDLVVCLRQAIAECESRDEAFGYQRLMQCEKWHLWSSRRDKECPVCPIVQAGTVLRDLVVRFGKWDHLEIAGDGAYWRREIDRVLRATEAMKTK